jgi:hypothetical protein
MFLPVIPVSDASNSTSDLQSAKITMSPVEHSRKHRQRTGPKGRVRDYSLPGDQLCLANIHRNGGGGVGAGLKSRVRE